jgi:hypothetical protein
LHMVRVRWLHQHTHKQGWVKKAYVPHLSSSASASESAAAASICCRAAMGP